MKMLRKHLMVQFILFIVFFMMGANIIVGQLLGEQMPWLTYVILGLLFAGVILGFFVYRGKDTSFVTITEKEVAWLKYALYTYFIVYIVNMLASSIVPSARLIVGVVAGALLMVIAAVGIVIQIRIIRIK